MSSQRARWLAWATAVLLIAGVASAGALSATGSHADLRIVTAAGDTTGPLAPPTPAGPSATETPAPPATAAPTTAPAPTPAPAARPVAAPTPASTGATTAATTPPARVPAPTAPFNPPGPPVTPPTTPTTTQPPTSTTITGRMTVTIVSQYAYDVDVAINGQTFRVAAGQSVGPLDLAVASNGNDSVEVRVVSLPTCGEGDAGGYFTPGGRFRLAVVPSGTCGDKPGMPAPNAVSTPV